MANFVRLEIPKNKVTLLPDSSGDLKADNNCAFDVTVINFSSEFASFEIEIFAKNKGLDIESDSKWYRVEPEICSKIQPGDKADFHVDIIKAPIPVYNTTIELIVRVFSIEYEKLSTTQTLLLSIGQPEKSLKVELPFKEIKFYPGDTLNIPVVIYNLSSRFREINVVLDDINLDWLHGKNRTTVRLDGGASEQVNFQCVPPEKPDTLRKISDFTVTAKYQDHDSDSDTGKLEILPYGEVKFHCLNPSMTIFSNPFTRLFKGGKYNFAEYKLQFFNASNQLQQINFNIHEANEQQFNWRLTNELMLVPGQHQDTSILVKKQPSLFLEHKLYLKVIPFLSHPNTGESCGQIQSNPNNQTLELKVKPIIPMWLSWGCGLLALCLLWLLSQPKAAHNAPVSSVRLIGSYGDTLVSGSSDQTIRHWQINKCLNIFGFNILGSCPLFEKKEIASKDKTQQAIRVIRERPVRQGEIAAGLENGHIQLWQVSPSENAQKPQTLNLGNSDRVFDLDFTQDSNYLFSGHGSGSVCLWDVRKNQSSESLSAQKSSNSPSFTPPLKGLSFGTAVSALEVIEISKPLGNPSKEPGNKPKKKTVTSSNGEGQRTSPRNERNNTRVLKPNQPCNIDISKKNSKTNLIKQNQPSLVAIVGQYKKFVLWDWENNNAYEVNYNYNKSKKNLQFQPIYSRFSYINSIAFTQNNNSPKIVTADDQGFLTLWDVSQLTNCASNQKLTQQNLNKIYTMPCEGAVLDQWQHGENNQSVPVRSVALTDDGEYLVSAGDDGRVVLWSQNKDKDKNYYQCRRENIDNFYGKKIRSVDIKRISTNEVLIAIAAPDKQVKVYRKGVQNDCQ